jgi:hypothetical protein
LEGVLALQPDASQGEPRLALFEEARAAGDHRAAVAAIQPLFERTSFDYFLQQWPSVFEEEAPDHYIDEWMIGQFLSGRGIEDRRRAAIAVELADSLKGQDRLSLASLFHQIGLRIDASAGTWQTVETLDAELERRSENARRRPVIHDELEQNNPVHPKLEAQP